MPFKQGILPSGFGFKSRFHLELGIPSSDLKNEAEALLLLDTSEHESLQPLRLTLPGRDNFDPYRQKRADHPHRSVAVLSHYRLAPQY